MRLLLLLVQILTLGGCHLIFPFNAADPGPGGDGAVSLDGKLLTDADRAEDATKDATNNDGPHKDATKNDGPHKDATKNDGPHKDAGLPLDNGQPLDTIPPPAGKWTIVTGPPTTAVPHYFNAAWCSGSVLFAAGDNGKAFRLNGSTWTNLYPPNINIESLWASSTTNLYAVGGTEILRYNGSSWTSEHTQTGNTLHGLWGFSSSDIYAVGSSDTVLHLEGGKWKAKGTSTSYATFYGVWGSAPNDLYVVGNQGKIQHYDGSTWSTTTPAGKMAIFKDVWGSGKNDVYVVGNAGKIYHFDGSGWKLQTGPSVALDAVWGTSKSCVYAAGNSGQIWSKCSASSWTMMSSPTTYGLMDIHSCTAGTFVVGRVNTILRLQ